MKFLQLDLASEQRDALLRLALERNWPLCFILIGWLHLVTFACCYYLELQRFHVPLAYLGLWVAEFLGMLAIFRVCAGPRPASPRPQPLEQFVRRVWIAYFILAFNLCSMHTLRGDVYFELIPAMASLASFAFIMMTLVVSWRFFAAVLVMFSAGLLMAAFMLHALLIFGIAWWIVLNGLGLELRRRRFPEKVEPGASATGATPGVPPVADAPGSPMRGEFVAPDLAATERFGHCLGELLFPGAVVALIGPLGAGKTQLVRFIAEGLQIPNSRVVSSPTFVLIQEYAARLPIYHFDAYRLNSPEEFADLGAGEYFAGQGVCLVEWADKVETCLPAEYLRIDIEVTGAASRRLEAQGIGRRYAELVAQLSRLNEPGRC